MQAVIASRDTEGLRKAIWSYLTELPARGPRAKGVALPYAFELWIAHLALVEQVLEMAPVGWQELPAAELEGILLLRSARERMRRGGEREDLPAVWGGGEVTRDEKQQIPRGVYPEQRQKQILRFAQNDQ